MPSQPFPLAFLGADVVAAAGATFGLTPFVSIIDKSITANASGKQALVRKQRTQASADDGTSPFSDIAQFRSLLSAGVLILSEAISPTPLPPLQGRACLGSRPPC